VLKETDMRAGNPTILKNQLIKLKTNKNLQNKITTCVSYQVRIKSAVFTFSNSAKVKPIIKKTKKTKKLRML